MSTGRKVFPKVGISNVFFIAHVLRFIYLWLKVFRKNVVYLF